ncbi:MAG: hypothetical protein KTR31_18510 [Myxococcales bacterium]|nr:hypothetical protein [Myxococcales bacterium]
MKRRRSSRGAPAVPSKADRQARLETVRSSLPSKADQQARLQAVRASLPSADTRQSRLDAVRDRQARSKEQLQARIAKRSPDKREPEKKRRRWLWAVLALLLLLFLLRDCSCAEEPEPVPEGTAPLVAAGDLGELPFIGPPVPPPPPVKRRDRPDYDAPTPEPLPWVAAFRMQVSARGPRLAECFVGSDRPGRLKWSTSVDPGDGRVSEHALEPMLLTRELTRDERSCVVGVLSDPPYRFAEAVRQSTPSRVGLVIEF